ncbi:hypothetical protein LCM10_10245 [Rossellomorea aquimaris]|uniref:hypothetical protein n=1 Tax=Rossellomorea aquimaris TaxID=189382 RepID=UPI001CD21870|nr:hypothetical protein [Rossellomorea aquimaris]MCA1055365.1 hypothetical protein [Rossellomorea aquimaris]
MKKIIMALTLSFTFPLLAACGSDDEGEMGENANADTMEMDEQGEATDKGGELLGSGKLQERIQPGMDIDAYAAELTAMEEKGETTLLKKYNLPGNKEIKANILQSSGGFVAVETDGLEVTDVNEFKSIQQVEKHLKDKEMEEE